MRWRFHASTIRGAAVVDPVQAELLGISAGDPLLLVNPTAFLGAAEALEHTTSYYRADRYEYSITHRV